MTLRVVIAEDNLLVREGVVKLLDHQEGIEVVGTCGTYDELMATVERETPRRRAHRHPHAADRHRRRRPRRARAARRAPGDRRRRAAASTSEPAYALALLEHGSEGRAYLLKERVSDVDQLVHAIREVARGGSVIDPIVVEALVEARAARPASPLDRLTPREREVLAEMAQGRNNAGIAQALGLSERAVEKHINSLFSKLGLSRGARRAPPGQGGAALPLGAGGLAPPRETAGLPPWVGSREAVRRMDDEMACHRRLDADRRRC